MLCAGDAISISAFYRIRICSIAARTLEMIDSLALPPIAIWFGARLSASVAPRPTASRAALRMWPLLCERSDLRGASENGDQHRQWLWLGGPLERNGRYVGRDLLHLRVGELSGGTPWPAPRCTPAGSPRRSAAGRPP